MEFGKRVKRRREELNMSQETLAQKLGYKSRSSINKIELGENDIPQSKIHEFARVLDTNVVDLIDNEYIQNFQRILKKKIGSNKITIDTLTSEIKIVRKEELLDYLLNPKIEYIPSEVIKIVAWIADFSTEEYISSVNYAKLSDFVGVPTKEGYHIDSDGAIIPYYLKLTDLVLSDQAKKILENYNKLNSDGQAKLADYSDDLVSSGRYTQL